MDLYERELLQSNSFVLQTENPDLFYAVPWSYGTLGFLVSAEIKIIPSKKFIKMEYFPVHSKEEMVQKFQEQTLLKDSNEFVETLAYSLDKAVVMTGNFTDVAESDKVGKINSYHLRGISTSS